MHDKYKGIELNHYKACLQEIGDAARDRGDHPTFMLIVQEWNNVEVYEKALTAPWGQQSKVLH